jgi:NAD(P)-dependent dehydrogenase (short-subunit alcohol dehydrogenase family)
MAPARSESESPGAPPMIALKILVTKNLVDELGPAGITVNLVHPGITVTERVAEIIAAAAAAGGGGGEKGVIHY